MTVDHEALAAPKKSIKQGCSVFPKRENKRGTLTDQRRTLQVSLRFALWNVTCCHPLASVETLGDTGPCVCLASRVDLGDDIVRRKNTGRARLRGRAGEEGQQEAWEGEDSELNFGKIDFKVPMGHRVKTARVREVCPQWCRGWPRAPVYLCVLWNPQMFLSFSYLTCKLGVFIAHAVVKSKQSVNIGCCFECPLAWQGAQNCFFEGWFFWNILRNGCVLLSHLGGLSPGEEDLDQKGDRILLAARW